MDFLNKAATAAKERANTALAGKQLLADGGPPMEKYLTAKANIRSSVQSDAVTKAQVADTMAQYEQAIAQIEDVLADTASTIVGDDQKIELGTLLVSYKERLDTLKLAIDVLKGDIPGPPTISAPEEDAIKMLYVKGKVEDAKARSQDVASKAVAAIQAKEEKTSV